MEKLKNNKGFTLVENLIYMGIFSILLVVFVQMFSAIIDVHLESMQTSTMSQDENFIVSRLSYDILRSTNIQTPALGATNSTLQITGSGFNDTFSVTSGNLLLTDSSGTSTQLNSSNTQVSNISFVTLGNSTGIPTVKVTFTLQSKVIRHGNTTSKTFQTTIGRRI